MRFAQTLILKIKVIEIEQLKVPHKIYDSQH